MTFDEWFKAQKYMSTVKPIAQDAWNAATTDSQAAITALRHLLLHMREAGYSKARLAEIMRLPHSDFYRLFEEYLKKKELGE